MQTYFQFFPYTRYNFDNSSVSYDVVTNIFSRIKFLDSILSNVNSYYQYQVQDTDTPQIIAYKYYQNANRYWLVLLFNQYLDPYFSFPVTPTVLDNLMIEKYGSLAVAQNTLKQVERVTTTDTYINNYLTSQTSNTYVITGNSALTYEFPKSANTIADEGSLVNSNYPALNYPPITETLGPFVQQGSNGLQTLYIKNTYYSISVYDYEIRANDQKRNINLVNLRYVAEIEAEFKKLLQSG